MNLPAAIYAVRWLVWDTFRQALASGIFWLMLGVSGLCILVCLSVQVADGTPLHREGERPDFVREPMRAANETDEAYQKRLEAFRAQAATSGVDIVSGELTLAFGAIRVPIGRDAVEAVRFLQLLLAGAVADAAGILLALIWTAGFLPTFLESSAAAVLLAKPVPRWSLLVGKYLGVLAFVAFQAGVFIGGTWMALGLRTGIWDPAYLLSIPLLILHFAIFFSFSTLLAVATRSTIACVFGSLLFWFLCWGMNYGRHAVLNVPELAGMSSHFRWLVEAGYWILPKPVDLSYVLFHALHAEKHFAQLLDFQDLQAKGLFHPELSVVASLLFTGAMLAIAAREFILTDY